MRRAIVRAVLPLVGAGIIATSARAGSAEDGNAGLDALNRGSHGEAVRLFTRALKAGDLAKDDQEFAYLNRGKAYLAEGKKTLAVADFRKATGLKPDDAEAQAALQGALTGRARTTLARAATVDPDAAWGTIAKQLDQYWVTMDADPVSYSICRWQTPHRVIGCEGLGKNGKQYAATYELNPSTGAITYRETTDTTLTATVEVHGDSYALDIEMSGKYIRESTVVAIVSPLSPARAAQAARTSARKVM